MSLSGINFSGLGSGIDTDNIIKQLVSLQQRPITKMQQQQAKIQQQQTAVAQVSAIVTGLQAAAFTLDGSLGFSLVTASVTDDSIAKVTASAGAQTGSHTLQVLQLAQAQRIGSTTLTSETDALGVAGQIVINGKAIKISSTDSLQNIASSINNAGVGVNASIISPSTGSYRLVLGSTKPGASNTISLSDVGSGTILSSTLGLIGGATTVRNAITDGAASNLFTDSATSVGTLLGMAEPPSGTISINGSAVTQAIDLATDSLATIAAKINNSGITGVTAGVETVKDAETGKNMQQLRITGASGTPTFTDGGNILANLGIVQKAATDQLAVARDSKFKLDGIEVTRTSNTVTDVLSGVTLQLIKDTGQPTTEFTVASDIQGIKTNIGGLISQYNQLNSTVAKLSAFDPDTLSSGPLFGDVTVQNLMNQITDIVSGPVNGLTGAKALFSQIGITLDKTGQLNVNDGELTAALQSNLSEVARIFRAAGVATNNAVSFISATEKTKASSGQGYLINVTQVAAKAALTAGTAHTADDNPDSEVLTFSGAAFGSATRTLILNAGITLDGIISRINSDTTLSGVMTATSVGGKLALTANQFGASSSFTVSSSQAAAANNSGIGNSAVSANGQDVAGTINGEAATGKGQVLTGNKGNAFTEGLQIRVNSLVAGDMGALVFTQGLAAQVKYQSKAYSDSVDGALTKYASSLGDQVKDLTDAMEAAQERLKGYETNLRIQFAAMEGAISRVKTAANGLAALGALQTNSSK